MKQIPFSLSKLSASVFLCLIILFFVTACQADKEEAASVPDSEESNSLGLPEGLPLRILAEKVYLRSEAGVDGKVVAEIPENELVFGSEEVSAFVTQLKKQGQSYEAPWIKVQTVDGKQGWVFASPAFLQVEGNQASFLLEKRLEATFGKKLARAYQEYERSKDTLQRAADLRNALRALRQLQTVLQEQFQQNNQASSAFWLRDLIPELVIHREQEGQPTEIYLDYRHWWTVAQQTPDSIDDLYLDVCISAYSEDSIEYRFPDWFIPTSPTDGHSLLGRGIHLEMFEKIENLSKLTPLFNNELLFFKNALIEDIILLNTTYWEEKNEASAELEEILKRDFAFLEPQDRLALQKRLDDFKKAEELGILFNFKSGIY
jgi:hypothetical protein